MTCHPLRSHTEREQECRAVVTVSDHWFCSLSALMLSLLVDIKKLLRAEIVSFSLFDLLTAQCLAQQRPSAKVSK